MQESGDRKITEVKSGYADRLMRSHRFDAGQRPDIEKSPRLYRFRGPDDEIEGWLLGGPFANWRQSASYIIDTEGGQREFFGNKQLHSILPDLIGKYVRVRMIGWEKLPGVPRPRKVYRVWQIEGLGLVAPKQSMERTTGVHREKVTREPDDL